VAVSLVSACEPPRRPAAAARPDPAYVPPPPPPMTAPVPVVETLVLRLTILGVRLPPTRHLVYDRNTGTTYVVAATEPPPLVRTPRFATGVTLIRSDGSAVRFVDETARRPEVRPGDTAGAYLFTIDYTPQKAEQVVGLPLETLSGFQALSADFAPVLEAMGLRYAGIAAITIFGNGGDATVAVDALIPAGTDASVGAAFAELAGGSASEIPAGPPATTAWARFADGYPTADPAR